MQVLLVVDAQNEFSPRGQRAIPNHAEALAAVRRRVRLARAEKRPIAWVQHHNRSHESKAFVPGSWGAQLSEGFGPQTGYGTERLFVKDVFGAFTGTELDAWLKALAATEVLIVGFFAHMCVSTSAREALIRGYEVSLDPEATGARDLHDNLLGSLKADEVVRTAFLHLTNMGATIAEAELATTDA